MITNREMMFVNQKEETKIPYPGSDYAKDALLELKEALVIYDTYYKNKMFDIIFSNGENLEFAIEENTFSHLVGMPNMRTFIEKGIIEQFYQNEYINSYQLLTDIMNNIDDFLKVNEEANFSLFNFYRIKVRSEVFAKFSNFTDYNFGAIHYDKNIAEKNGHPTNMNAHTFLFVESNDANYPYHMMGLAKDMANKQYVETLFPTAYLEKMFKGQTISLPTAVSITQTESFSKGTISASQKLRQIKQMMDIAKANGAHFEFFNDYLTTVSEAARQEERKNILTLTK